MDHQRWKTAQSLKGPYADINEHYINVWMTMDSFGRVHHVIGDLRNAADRLETIRGKLLGRMHDLREKDILFSPGDVMIDGLPGGRNRMIVNFHFSAYGDRWTDDQQDDIASITGGIGVRDYKKTPKS